MNSSKSTLPTYGGQALIEGVMMRGSKFVAAAMRSPDGQIKVISEPLGKIYQNKIKKVPFLRGLLLLWDSLGLGIRFLTESANIQTGEHEKVEGPALYLTLIISFSIGIGLFFIAPAALGQWSESLIGWTAWWSNLFEGIIRLILVVTYIYLIGLLPDIRRVFAYHGAEHKTINAFESGTELTVENVAQFSLEHPRCGTSFLLTLILLSVIVFAFLGPLPILWRLITRVLFIPILAGIAYEYIRWTANHLSSQFVKTLIIPNLALQRLTTHQPDNSMIEVAITAFSTMYALEHKDLSTEQ
jgi:uncharacterized protein YqhQ